MMKIPAAISSVGGSRERAAEQACRTEKHEHEVKPAEGARGGGDTAGLAPAQISSAGDEREVAGTSGSTREATRRAGGEGDRETTRAGSRLVASAPSSKPRVGASRDQADHLVISLRKRVGMP